MARNSGKFVDMKQDGASWNSDNAFELVEVETLQIIKGVPFASGYAFRQFLVTGPPGAGKSSLIKQIGGWPSEGYIDLTVNGWWNAPSLVVRPREVHLGVPFKGTEKVLTVFDAEWLEADAPLEIDFERILLPPEKGLPIFGRVRSSFVFEFLLPPAATILKWREGRADSGCFPVDVNLSMDQVERQITVYSQIALFFHNSGLQVFVRDKPLCIPKVFSTKGEGQKRPAPPRSPWQALFRFIYPGDGKRLELSTVDTEIEGSVVLSPSGCPFELRLGSRRLLFMPDLALLEGRAPAVRNWLVTDPDMRQRDPYGVLGLNEGGQFLIGKDNRELGDMIGFAAGLLKRQVLVSEQGGEILVQVLETSRRKPMAVCISRADDAFVERQKRRRAQLAKVRKIFDGDITILSPEQALRDIQCVLKIMDKEVFRPKDDCGRPGGVVEIPDHLTPIIVGDLHAMVDNLLKILSENSFLKALEKNRACLLILGDALHSEAPGSLEDMDASILILDVLLKLKLRFPKNVFYLRGNHDSFSKEVCKGGVQQGELMQAELGRLRGEAYCEAVGRYFETLPYAAKGKDFIAVHGAPSRTCHSYSELVNIRDHPKIARELTFDRLRRTNSPTGYGNADVVRFRKLLGMRKDAVFIVSHTPVTDHDSVWLHVHDIKNHHVIYCAHATEMSVFTRVRDNMVALTYLTEPLIDITNIAAFAPAEGGE